MHWCGAYIKEFVCNVIRSNGLPEKLLEGKLPCGKPLSWVAGINKVEAGRNLPFHSIDVAINGEVFK